MLCLETTLEALKEVNESEVTVVARQIVIQKANGTEEGIKKDTENTEIEIEIALETKIEIETGNDDIETERVAVIETGIEIKRDLGREIRRGRLVVQRDQENTEVTGRSTAHQADKEKIVKILKHHVKDLGNHALLLKKVVSMTTLGKKKAKLLMNRHWIYVLLKPFCL